MNGRAGGATQDFLAGGALATPAGARVFPTWIVYAVVALTAALFAVTRARTSPKTTSRANLFGALTLLVWAIATLETLWASPPPVGAPLSGGSRRVGSGPVGVDWGDRALGGR